MEGSQAEMDIPTFDVKSIIEIMTTLGLECKLTPKDMKNPSIETMTCIYKKFLETCISVSPNTFDLEPSDGMLHFDQDTLKIQSDSFKFLQFYALMQYFFDLCGIPQKEFTDIFHPTRKVLLKNISTMINFSRFEFDELPDFSAVQEQNKEYIDNCISLKNELDEMRNSVRFLESKKQTEKEPIENAKKRIAAIKEKAAAVREQRKKLASHREAVRKEDDSNTNEMNQTKARQQEIQKKMLLYEKLLVRSPERLNKSLEKNEARIVELKKHVEAKREEIESLKADLFEREKFVENFKQITETLENFHNNDIKKATEKHKEIEILRENITSLKFDIQQLGSTIQSLQAENEKINSEIQREKQGLEREMMQLKEKDDAFKQKMKECLQGIEENKNKHANLMDQREKFIKKSKQLQADAFETIIQYQKNDEMSKKAFEVKMTTLSKYEKEAKKSVDGSNKLQTKLFDFLKEN